MSNTAIKRGNLLDKCHAFTRVDLLKAAGIYPYFRAIQESEGPVVQMEGKKVIMAGSNNYLGLTTHPKVKEAAIRALEKYGTSCSGSRYLTGTIDLHEEMEVKIAEFMGKEAALLYTTGYQTGQGVIQPMVGRNDIIFSDKDNHASIVSGNLMAKGVDTQVVRYKHNDMDDLRKRLLKAPEDAGKLIVTDGVFSAFGNIVNLKEMQKVAAEFGAQVLLDDAHAFGVIGEGGRGTASEFGLTNEIDLTLCTFSKTLASIGGFVVGSERAINYLKHHSSALIFSASPTPASVAAALAALEVLKEEPQRVAQVNANAERVRKGLKEMGYIVKDGRTAIVPVMIYDDEKAFKLWKSLYDGGVFVNVFVSPATPPNSAMMRNSFMATHEDFHLDQILEAYKKAGKAHGII
ncbi:MAG: 8-amino-7-oxononanoate synthase [Bacteroidota bacterium]